MHSESNWSNIRADVEAWFKRFAEQHSCKCATQEELQTSERALSRKIDRVLKEIKKMAVSTDALLADIQTLVGGYEAVKAENVALKAALASADANQAQAVADAVAAEDASAQAKIDAADAVVDAANAPAAPPADGGDTPAE